MKYLIAEKVFGQLSENETPVLLGITESSEEQMDLIKEYEDVFGWDKIIFSFNYATKEEIIKLKTEAWAKVFNSLYGPINKVVNALKNK